MGYPPVGTCVGRFEDHDEVMLAKRALELAQVSHDKDPRNHNREHYARVAHSKLLPSDGGMFLDVAVECSCGAVLAPYGWLDHPGPRLFLTNGYPDIRQYLEGPQ